MIDVKDRIPTYPGRVKLIPVAGQANTYDMVRADEPIEPGTPINRALFQGFIDEMDAIRQQVNNTLFDMSQRVAIGTLTEGSVISLYENGIRVPFIIIGKWYGTGRVTVLRRDIYKMDTLYNEGEEWYSNSKADKWLENEYVTYLDPATQGVLTSVNIQSSIRGGLTTISRKAFFLSAREHGISNPYTISEGEMQPYFAVGTPAERRVALFNGVAAPHWTRSMMYSQLIASTISEAGSEVTVDPYTDAAGYRPAFTLPVDFEVTVGVPSTENVMATAEV